MSTTRLSTFGCLTAICLAISGSQTAHAQMARTQNTSKTDAFVEPFRQRVVEAKTRKAFLEGRSLKTEELDPFLCTRILSADLQHRYEWPRTTVAPGRSLPLSLTFSADKLKDGLVSVKIIHGRSVQLLSGVSSEQSVARSGDVYKSSWVVEPTSMGVHPVTIELVTDNQSERYSASQTFYLITNEDGTRIKLDEPDASPDPDHDDEFIRRSGFHQDTELDRNFAAALPGDSPDGTQRDGRGGFLERAAYTVSGQLRVDNSYGTIRNVPGIRIELQQKRSSSSSTYYTIATTTTGSDGRYTLNFSDSNLRSMRLRAYAEAAYGRIVDEDEATIYTTSSTWTPSAANKVFNWTMTSASSSARLFNIQALLKECYSSALNNFGTNMPLITVNMEAGDGAHAGDGAQYIGRDCWNNDDTIRHEYGHNHHVEIAGQFPANSGGSHNFGRNGTTGMALSEGYATFFHCVTANVKGWNYTVPRNPNDIQLENNNTYQGDRDEGSIAGMMVDIWDGTSVDDNDTINIGARRVGDVIRLDAPDTFSEFYGYWNRNNLSQLVNFRNTLETRGLNYGW